MGKLEGKIENYLVKKCKEINALCYKFTSPANRGVPDRVIIYNGTVAFVELKAEGQKLRKLQEVVINELKKHKATTYVLDSKEKVDEFIKTISHEEK